MIINTAKAFLARQGLQNAAKNKVIARQFNFASSQYASCFADIPTPDVAKFRQDAIAYLDGFDGKKWYDDPVSLCRVSVVFQSVG